MLRVYSIILFVFASEIAIGQNKGTKKIVDTDVVICADLSASTNGLITDLKENFWQLINHHATLTPQTNLRISYIFYGRPSFGSKSSFVKIATPLSNAYDSIFNVIDDLKPNIEKGDQFVEAALDQAINHINWSTNKQALKCVFIIGNGSIMPGPGLEKLCQQANQKHITINTIYCNSSLTEKELKWWEKLAYFGNGKSAAIHINKVLPSDGATNIKSLYKLNNSLNQTIIGYGINGNTNHKLMQSIDSASLQNNASTFAARLIYKTAPANNCLPWDLTCISSLPNFNLFELDRENLPEQFTNTSGNEMLEILKNNREQRQLILTQINELLEKDLVKIKTNYVVQEIVGEEGNLNRVIIKQFVKQAIAHGSSW
ncbi:MAG: hypothetical protein JNK61_10900 [Bacteroidia bacterium]|nr:hypothetical protein [Bacteroidia bacterium]HQV00659.1 hypothetical protein [Bacteroidia bacterium]